MLVFRCSIAIPTAMLFTLRRTTLPHPTQNSLPVLRLTTYRVDVSCPLCEAPFRAHCLAPRCGKTGSASRNINIIRRLTLHSRRSNASVTRKGCITIREIYFWWQSITTERQEAAVLLTSITHAPSSEHDSPPWYISFRIR